MDSDRRCGKGRKRPIPFDCKLGFGHEGKCSPYTLPPLAQWMKPTGEPVRGDRLTEHAADNPAMDLLQVSVPLRIMEIAAWTTEARIAAANRAGEHIAYHGDNLMFRSKDHATATAFNELTTGLACAAYQPGGITFAGMHFCTDHKACLDAQATVSEENPPMNDREPSVIKHRAIDDVPLPELEAG